MQFGLFSVSALGVSLFLHFCIIKIPLHFGNFFLVLLPSRLVHFRAFLFVEGELLHALLEDIGQRILDLGLRRLLFQHYNILISFIPIAKGQRLLVEKLKSTLAQILFCDFPQKVGKQLTSSFFSQKI